MDSYHQVLEIVGEICGDIIAPNAEGVDQEGPTVSNGRVKYAKAPRKPRCCSQCRINGDGPPREFGGLNFPVVYIMAADIVSRADAGFQNLWGLQDCAQTLYNLQTKTKKTGYCQKLQKGYNVDGPYRTRWVQTFRQ